MPAAKPGDRVGPTGLESIIEYDCLQFGDREDDVDCYVVTSISGLDDAELRRETEDRHTQHGEIYVSAFHGGRTIVLEGEIRAGNMDRLRNMQEYLKLGLTRDLIERPLYFRTGTPGIYDRFFFGSALSDYTFFNGAAFVQVVNRAVAVTSTSKKDFVHTGAGRQYTNATTIIKFTYGDTRPGTSDGIGPIIKSIGVTGLDYLFARITQNDIRIVKRDSGSETTLATGTWSGGGDSPDAIRLEAFRPYWMSVDIAGNVITASLWAYDPSIPQWPETDPINALVTVTHTLAGGDATKFGSGVQGYSGVRWVPQSISDVLNMFRVIPTNSTRDTMVWAVKGAPVVIREQQPDMRLARDFQITLRASDPRIYSGNLKSQTLSAAQALGPDNFTLDYRIYNLSYDRTYRESAAWSRTPDLVDYVTNVGTYPVFPNIIIYGPFSNPRFVNYTTGQSFRLAMSVPTGEFVVVDQNNRTVRHSSGWTMYSVLAPGSQWVQLWPGMNSVRALTDVSRSGSIVLQWRDAWV